MSAMTRRGFFAALISTVAGAKLDPERLLWVPGKRRIFIPPARNCLLTPDVIARETLAILRRNLAFAQRVNREFDQQFTAPRIVTQLNVRKPRRFQQMAAAGLVF